MPSNRFLSSYLCRYPCYSLHGDVFRQLSPEEITHDTYEFVQLTFVDAPCMINRDIQYLACKIPVVDLIPHLTKDALFLCGLNLNVVSLHQASTRTQYCTLLLEDIRVRSDIDLVIPVFKHRIVSERSGSRKRHLLPASDTSSSNAKRRKLVATTQVSIPLTDEIVKTYFEHDDEAFPPPALSSIEHSEILRNFISCTSPDALVEAGCAICSELTPLQGSHKLSDVEPLLDFLAEYAYVTRKERFTEDDEVEFIDDIVIDRSCTIVCNPCYNLVKEKEIPKNSLANGLWIGDVPEVLKKLTWAERRLISKIRLNSYVVQVTSGRVKMMSNVVAFANPMAKVYDRLPPPLHDIDQVLAIVYLGQSEPMPDDMERTPLLVRRNYVADGLNWLKLNHCGFQSISISDETLNQYPVHGVPFTHIYRYSKKTKGAEKTSVYDKVPEDGVEHGPCPFIVHGLVGKDIVNVAWSKLVKLAKKHMNTGGLALGIGHSDTPESIFANPSLYPEMFPWLFPYGLGGIQNSLIKKAISPQKMKAHYLMYHDKQFQTDRLFPIVALNHEQIQTSATGSYLLTKKSCLRRVTDNILDIDEETLENLIERLKEGEHVVPTTSEEKKCFDVLKDLDHVSHEMDGSMSSRKKLRGQLWATMCYHGAPSWFITFSPSDSHHPIAMYYAGLDETFRIDALSNDEKYRRCASNPVAAARFFHFVVTAFITHVLGFSKNKRGIYGKVKSYFGTVEQQGRLTLHIHMLLWICGALSPLQIKNRLLAQDSDFQKALFCYLESCHTGDYLDADHSAVNRQVDLDQTLPDYSNPTGTLPTPPPRQCGSACATAECPNCQSYLDWMKNYNRTVNDILFRVNYHLCHKNICMNNKKGVCRARFPREFVPVTTVDSITGHVSVKKREARLNTFTPELTYLLRCNTDTTSLLSGTAVKAAMAYATDYISKVSLKTHVVFKSLKTTFTRSTQILESDSDRSVIGRKVITRLANSLIGKMEIGAPMASMYLLGNPDHYTNLTFVNFYWRSFVSETLSTTHDDNFNLVSYGSDETVLLQTQAAGCGIYAISPVMDYIYRPDALSHFSLYDAVLNTKKMKLPAETGPTTSIRRHLADTHDTYDQSSDLSRMRYLCDHPQTITHFVTLLKPSSDRIPNLLGGNIPRRDIGDREYYCAVMLTFFKPWRTGKDLRDLNETWSSAFENYTFRSDHLKIMDHFHLKYECLDARDDFASRQADKNPNSYADIDLAEHLAANPDDEHESDVDDLDELSHNMYNTITDHGPKAYRHLLQMNQMRDILTVAGWFLDCSTEYRHSAPAVALDHTIDWKKLLENKQESILQKRLYCPPNTADPPTSPEDQSTTHRFQNVVRLIALKDLKSPATDSNALLLSSAKSDVASLFQLNADQNRAFRLITDHLTSHNLIPLTMYLGGMAGTGKSQVIKAVTSYFDKVSQRFRLALLAPTGSAASLIGGSTYHSFLGVTDYERMSIKRLTTLKERLDRIDYIIIDEVSMLSLRDLYKISAQLANIKNTHDKPFGGVNIIFAGDFAQLPPPMNSTPLYGDVSKRKPSSYVDQQTCIGKTLWLQTTTVVILRDNMRQRTCSLPDQKLRTALQNMRYKSCTQADILYLRTLSIYARPGTFSNPAFRNISIITALNAQRDEINNNGCIRYAFDTNQELQIFNSIDSISTSDTPGRRKNKYVLHPPSSKKSSVRIRDDLQEIIWDLPPADTEHQPGSLALCKGLPVLIKYNQATECCITNGAEATVVDWISASDVNTDRRFLKTVFVELVNPPQEIQLDGLPPNVVPITPEKRNIICKLPNDTELAISREQVPLIPNFAMTDFGSQGRTRPKNPVHLENCRSFQSYYTCLSRSSSSAGTVIIGTFDPKMIQGGVSGWLRQEFRDLELLDHITKLSFEKTLQVNPDLLHGSRYTLISWYRGLAGHSYVPPNVPAAISWTETDYDTENVPETPIWKILDKKTFRNRRQ